MNGSSLLSLCPWLRALKLAPAHKRRKKGFFAPHLTHTQGSQTLFENVHPHRECDRGRRSECGAWESSSALLMLLSIYLPLPLFCICPSKFLSVCRHTHSKEASFPLCCYLLNDANDRVQVPTARLAKPSQKCQCLLDEDENQSSGDTGLLGMSRAEVLRTFCSEFPFADLNTFHPSLGVVLWFLCVPVTAGLLVANMS